MSNLILCDGNWTQTATGWDCAGAVTQVVYSAPAEFTTEMAVAAFASGFATVLPVLAVIFGGRQILKMLR